MPQPITPPVVPSVVVLLPPLELLPGSPVLVPALGSIVVPSLVAWVGSVVTVLVVPESVAVSEPTLVPEPVVGIGVVVAEVVGSPPVLGLPEPVLESPVLVRATASSLQADRRAGIKARLNKRMPAA
jgi:hypothetical protein